MDFDEKSCLEKMRIENGKVIVWDEVCEIELTQFNNTNTLISCVYFLSSHKWVTSSVLRKFIKLVADDRNFFLADSGYLREGLPKYVHLAKCIMVLEDWARYCNDQGAWHVGFEVRGEKIYAISSYGHLNGKELIPATEKEWREYKDI